MKGFVLRRITKSGIQMNIALGTGYSLVHKEHSKAEFDKNKKQYKWDNCIYAFISYNNDKNIVALSENQKSFIMADNGEIFDKFTAYEV